MTVMDQQRELLESRCTERTTRTNVSYRVELRRDSQGLHLIASRDSRWGNPFPTSFARALSSPTASQLEFDFERLCLELAGGSEADLNAANQLSDLFYRMMRDVSEKVRIANQTTRAGDLAHGFDVGVFQWGEHDFEFACRFVDPRKEPAKLLPPFDRVFGATTLQGAADRVRQHWELLARVAATDSESLALLDEYWRACERALEQARSAPLPL